jgi:hypothetical protein
LRFRQIGLALLQLLPLQLQGLSGESPVCPGHYQGEAEHDQGGTGNSNGAEGGDAYGMGKIHWQT